MPNGQVDIRKTERTGKSRLRFYAVADEHLETIVAALRIARQESGSAYDSVALDAICMHFLATYVGKKPHAKLASAQEFNCQQFAHE